MWLVRLLIGGARPSARGRNRRGVGPPSTVIEVIRISSPIRSWLFSAFAAAESISLWMSRAAPRGEKERSARACSMCRPRTWSATRRALRGATRTYFAVARTTGSSPESWERRRRDGAGFFSSALASDFLARRRGFLAGFSSLFSLPLAAFLSAFGAAFLSESFFAAAFFGAAFLSAFGFASFLAAAFFPVSGLVAFSSLGAAAFFSFLSFSSAISRSRCLVATAVRAEGAGGGELAELVTNHRLGDEDRHVFFAVVHGDRVADHLGVDRRGARPGFEHLFFAGLVHRIDLRQQPLFGPRALFG